MRLSILTHYYAPEIGAPQTRLRETAARLMELEWEVRVITCQPHYPHGIIPRGYSAFRPRHERIDGWMCSGSPRLLAPTADFSIV